MSEMTRQEWWDESDGPVLGEDGTDASAATTEAAPIGGSWFLGLLAALFFGGALCLGFDLLLRRIAESRLNASEELIRDGPALGMIVQGLLIGVSIRFGGRKRGMPAAFVALFLAMGFALFSLFLQAGGLQAPPESSLAMRIAEQTLAAGDRAGFAGGLRLLQFTNYLQALPFETLAATGLGLVAAVLPALMFRTGK